MRPTRRLGIWSITFNLHLLFRLCHVDLNIPDPLPPPPPLHVDLLLLFWARVGVKKNNTLQGTEIVYMVLKELQSNAIPLKDCRGQGYENGSIYGR